MDRFVRERARGRCEYCRLRAALHPAPFQIDHIIARQHGGGAETENLALAYIHCNRYKVPNIAGVDPDSGEIIRLFHPRRDEWSAHFTWVGARVMGLTPEGRATIRALNLNDTSMTELREGLREERKF